MSSAKLYVSANVVDRLTRPVANSVAALAEGESPSFDATNRPVMDMASFMGSIGAANFNTSTTGNNAFQTPGRSQSAPRGGAGGSSSSSVGGEESKEARAQRFQQFLKRQEKTLQKKEEKVQEVSSAGAIHLIYADRCYPLN